MPTPIPLVRINASPTRSRNTAPDVRRNGEFDHGKAVDWSGASMEWPPATGMPASAHIEAPPPNISRTVSTGSLSNGIPSMASAIRGRLPIAQDVRDGVGRAHWPKSRASSTIGMKKSVVAMTNFLDRHLPDGGIVAGLRADQERRVSRGRWLTREKLLQNRRCELTSAAAAMRQISQADEGLRHQRAFLAGRTIRQLPPMRSAYFCIWRLASAVDIGRRWIGRLDACQSTSGLPALSC